MQELQNKNLALEALREDMRNIHLKTEEERVDYCTHLQFVEHQGNIYIKLHCFR